MVPPEAPVTTDAPLYFIGGAAMSLLVIDIVLGRYVVRMSLASLGDRVTDFGSTIQVPWIGPLTTRFETSLQG
jgi:hypothetical protein